MAATLPLSSLDSLLQIAFLVNGGYLLFRKNLGTPLGEYIRLERDIRARLVKAGKAEDAGIDRQRRRVAVSSRKSERMLRWLLHVSVASFYLAAVAALAAMVLAALADPAIGRPWAVALLAVAFFPIPLSLLTLWAAARLYLGRIQRQLLTMAKKMDILDDIKQESAGGDRIRLLTNAITHIETALEKGGSGKKG